MSGLPEDIRRLSVAERIQLLEDLWDSILEDEVDPPALTDEQRAELDRRLALHRADPERARPWREVRERLTGER